MTRLLLIAAVLASSAASAQIPIVSRLARGTALSPLPQDADPIDYWAGAFMDQTGNCARFTVDGRNWLPCTATAADVAVVQGNLDTATAAISTSLTAVSGVATSAQTAAASAATAASAAQTTATNAATAASAAQTVANAAQTAATNAGTAAAAAQSTANAAQTASSTNATAITALQATVAAIPRRGCNTASVTGLSIPLLGISTTSTVTVTSAPVGTSCDVGVPSFLPLGAKAEAAVLTAGTVSLRFVSNTGLLSAVINIPNGTYRVCCDL